MTLSERIAALEEAIASGARRVLFRSGGTQREVEYHSLKDMRNELARLREELNGTSSRTYGIFRSGL